MSTTFTHSTLSTATKVETNGDKVMFPRSYTWKQMFIWIKHQNRDVAYWKLGDDGRANCFLKPINTSLKRS